MVELQRDSFGRVVLVLDGVEHRAVVPVRAFPISAPDEGIALVGAEGRELAWIDRLQDLPPAQRSLVEEELAAREFMPEIRRIIRVSGYVTPCTWTVDTDRGETEFVLKSEESIRRLSRHGLLIADSRGISFLVRDMRELDAWGRKVLDRFL
jgi:Domain of unknown function (DUF1854)